MILTPQELERIAQLAHLSLSTDDIHTYVPQIESILSHMNDLQAVVVPHEDPSEGVGAGIMREDNPMTHPDFSPQAQAPQWEGGFVVPRIS